MELENGNKILGIWISIFLGFGFWRDFGFSPQEGFGEECGRNFWVVFHNFLNNVNIIIQYKD